MGSCRQASAGPSQTSMEASRGSCCCSRTAQLASRAPGCAAGRTACAFADQGRPRTAAAMLSREGSASAEVLHCSATLRSALRFAPFAAPKLQDSSAVLLLMQHACFVLTLQRPCSYIASQCCGPPAPNEQNQTLNPHGQLLGKRIVVSNSFPSETSPLLLATLNPPFHLDGTSIL